jgi:hypothetical protein
VVSNPDCRRMLRHLHPKLTLPTLRDTPAPQAGKAPPSAALRQYGADHAACMRLYPGSLLPAKRKAPGGYTPAQQLSGDMSREGASGGTAAEPVQRRQTVTDVLGAAAAVLGMPPGALGGATVNSATGGALPSQLQTLPELLAVAARFPPWKQRCLAQRASAALPGLALASGPGALQGCLALLDAAGGAADAVGALLAAVPRLLVAEALSSRTAGSGGDSSGAGDGSSRQQRACDLQPASC